MQHRVLVSVFFFFEKKNGLSFIPYLLFASMLYGMLFPSTSNNPLFSGGWTICSSVGYQMLSFQRTIWPDIQCLAQPPSPGTRTVAAAARVSDFSKNISRKCCLGQIMLCRTRSMWKNMSNLKKKLTPPLVEL